MNGELELHLIRPMWLLLLPLVLLLPWAWWRMSRPGGDWERICDSHLLRWLSGDSVNQTRQRRTWAASLMGLTLLLAIVALAGPSWQAIPESSLSSRQARVVALDLSASMLAQDLRPDRLTRARFRLADLLLASEEGQTGLVAFAGDAYVVSPLTNDTNTIAKLLPALSSDVMPVAGSRADLALDLAAELLQRAGFSSGEILLISDGADSRAEARARALSDRNIRVSVMAVGSDEGAPIPSGGGFVTDRAGNVVISRVDEAALQRVAAAGGGRFSRLDADGGTPWLEGVEEGFLQREEGLDRRWQDSGPYLVLLLLPLLGLGFRRGVLFTAPLLTVSLAMSPVQQAQANWWESLWQRPDQLAWQALQEGDSHRAASLAQAPDLSGESWYRAQGWGNALSAWGRQDTPSSHFNRGNALAHMGELEAAIAAYDRALELDPGLDDARFNRDLLQQERERQQQQQDQQGDGEEGDSGDAGEPGAAQEQQAQSEEGQPSDDASEGEEQEQQGEAEQGEGQRTQNDMMAAWSEEDAQAMEQWLRRIPDDPGGLLRRKFLYEHQRRGEPAAESESW